MYSYYRIICIFQTIILEKRGAPGGVGGIPPVLVVSLPVAFPVTAAPVTVTVTVPVPVTAQAIRVSSIVCLYRNKVAERLLSNLTRFTRYDLVPRSYRLTETEM